jgi:site-specific DNA-methyltransferase (adenine-specific)
MTTDDNDIVLDPFSGTGTTAISAKRLGRNYIEFELDKKYAEISRNKLEQVEPNFRIGESWVSFYLNGIVTLRNNDWSSLKEYFVVPTSIRAIDYQRAELKDKKWIPSDSECFTNNEGKIADSVENQKTKVIKRMSTELFNKTPVVAMAHG